jgi:hypothetical protein
MRPLFIKLEIVAAIFSTFLTEFITRGMLLAIYDKYSGGGDAPLMIHGLLAVFVYRPLVTAGIGALIVFLGWLIMARKADIPFKEGLIATAVGALISAAAAFFWSCLTVILLPDLLRSMRVPLYLM